MLIIYPKIATSYNQYVYIDKNDLIPPFYSLSPIEKAITLLLRLNFSWPPSLIEPWL
jgi:hypothetical protein